MMKQVLMSMLSLVYFCMRVQLLCAQLFAAVFEYSIPGHAQALFLQLGQILDYPNSTNAHPDVWGY